jgi:hypothetical protein
MMLDAKRLYYVLLGAIALLLVALLFCAYTANNLLQSQSTAVLDAKTKGGVFEEKEKRLAKARADITKYQDLAEIAKSIVPQDKDQAQAVRELVSIAESKGVKLGSITFPSSSLGDNKPNSQLKAVTGIAGVYSLDITVQSDAKTPAPFGSFIAFLDALEHNRRTALVDSIVIQPDTARPDRLSFTLTLREYIKP